MPVATVRLMVRLLAFLLVAGLADGQSAQPEVQTEPLKADDIMAPDGIRLQTAHPHREP